MEIPSPFWFAPDIGELKLIGHEVRLSPRLNLVDFQNSDLFPLVAGAGKRPEHTSEYQIPHLRLEDGRWVYLNIGFKDAALAYVGFGWGMLRNGFIELTVHEFREQLHSYRSWLESALGPTESCAGRVVYRKVFAWGEVASSSDWRTELPGILVRFKQTS